MAFLTIGGTEYLVRVGQARGRDILIENRRRAVDGSLLVDLIASKEEVSVEITGLASAGRFFTIAEANALRTTLKAGAVTVGGDMASITARARDIGYVDEQDYRTDPPTVFRWLSCTLEQV